MVVFYISNFVFIIIDILLVSNISNLSQISLGPDSMYRLFRSALVTAIWVPYMLVSVRVKTPLQNKHLWTVYTYECRSRQANARLGWHR